MFFLGSLTGPYPMLQFDGATVLPSQDGSNQECTCNETYKGRLRACVHAHHSSQSRVKIKANKQVTSPRSELDQSETQRETAGRLIFWPLLLDVVCFFSPTLPPSLRNKHARLLFIPLGVYTFYSFEKFSVA